MTKEELEKEAEDFAIKECCLTCSIKNPYSCEEKCECWIFATEGVKFGYDKANKWHYVKNGDLPNKELEEKQLLVRVCNYTKDCIFAYYMLDKYYSKNGKRFYSDTDCDYPIDIEDIIAWKEIVLPKESD